MASAIYAILPEDCAPGYRIIVLCLGFPNSLSCASQRASILRWGHAGHIFERKVKAVRVVIAASASQFLHFLVGGGQKSFCLFDTHTLEFLARCPTQML